VANPIVTEIVSLLSAPTPSTFLATGAMISQGATNLTPNTSALLTQDGDLTALLAAPLALTSLVWSAGTVVATAAANIPGLNTGDTFITTITATTPSAYNGTVVGTVTGTTTFTYPLGTNPGSETVAGTFTPANQGELVSMVDTFFGQGASQGVYVLELGAGDQSNGPAALGAFITANPYPQGFCSYLVPRSWDGNSGYLALVAQFENPTAKLSFFTTTTLGTYSSYTPQMVDVVAMVEAPTIALTEFSLATPFYKSLAYNPSTTNRLTPFGNSFLYGVTPYPQKGNNATLTALAAANVSYVGTGAEGGVSTATLVGGKTIDGNSFVYRYAVNWIQVNEDLNLANAVIEGSNNSVNPLWYNQDGVNRLQDVAVATLNNAVAYGVATGGVTRVQLDPVTFLQNLDNGVYAGQNVINAVPFAIYTAQQPSDFPLGIYRGLTCVFIPAQQFNQIVFNILVSQLVGSQ
jgi:hypothetical protein